MGKVRPATGAERWDDYLARLEARVSALARRGIHIPEPPEPVIPPTPLVTTLPGSPDDGDVVHYKVGDLIWECVWNAADSRWYVIGGPELFGQASGEVSTTNTSFIALSGGPSLTIPHAGRYTVGWEAYMYHDHSAIAFTGMGVNAPTLGTPVFQPLIGASNRYLLGRTLTGNVGAGTLAARYSATSGVTSRWNLRRIWAKPHYFH